MLAARHSSGAIMCHAKPRHWSCTPIGADFDDIPVNNLILRRPRSGRLEGWATHEIVEEAGS